MVDQERAAPPTNGAALRELVVLLKTIQLDYEELECVEEMGVAVASAGIGARAVLWAEAVLGERKFDLRIVIDSVEFCLWYVLA
jgi:hypothetical protein